MSRFACRRLVVAASLVGLSALFTAQRMTASHRAAFAAAVPAASRGLEITSRDIAVEPDATDDGVDGPVDLNGNEISPALATYSLDALGSLYEVHSPQTELPRLGSPKT